MFLGQKNISYSGQMGVATAKPSIKRGWDLRINEPVRQFFYLPLLHSENLSDQPRYMCLVLKRLSLTDSSTLDDAKAHREDIRQFGRFPYRNCTLKRIDINAEREFLTNGGCKFRLKNFLKVT